MSREIRVHRIDLNADLGEGMGNDEALMPFVTSCNIACGGHAGDEPSMRRALKLAKQAGVAAGAHPSYPDREHFGRRELAIPRNQLAEILTEQIAALLRLAADEGVKLTHVKPHGALYNAAARDPELAEVVADTVPLDMALTGPPDSELLRAATRLSVPFYAEGFVDRGYRSGGALIPRGEAGAMITDEQARVTRAVQLARGESFDTADGALLSLSVQTICLHGDSEGAVQSAMAVRRGLEQAGVEVKRFDG